MKHNRYVVVIGAVNMDICGRPQKKLIFRDSNPGCACWGRMCAS